MMGDEFRRIRHKLHLTQPQMAAVLGYEHGLTISYFECGRRPITFRLGLLMRAFAQGYRPEPWPKVKIKVQEVTHAKTDRDGRGDDRAVA